MADDKITNLSEIDWDHIEMHPHHGLEDYEPRPEYSEIVQERKRNKAVMALPIVRVTLRLFVILGACLLMKTIVDYANDIRDGIIEPPTYNELASIVYLVLGMVLFFGILMMARKLRQSDMGADRSAPLYSRSHSSSMALVTSTPLRTVPDMRSSTRPGQIR